MKNKIPLISIATTLTSISCFGNSINGEWTLDDTEEECEVFQEEGYSINVCLTFKDFDLSIIEGEIDDIKGEVELEMTYSYEDGIDTYSYDIEFELEDLKLTDESPEYQIEGDFLLDELELKEEVQLNCTLSEKTKLDCDMEFELGADEEQRLDFKINIIFEKSE